MFIGLVKAKTQLKATHCYIIAINYEINGNIKIPMSLSTAALLFSSLDLHSNRGIYIPWKCGHIF